MTRDLFGNEIITDPLLRDKFIEPPFSVLDTKSGNWQRRKKQWNRLGIQSELGRAQNLAYNIGIGYFDKHGNRDESAPSGATSIFDPALCEVLYHWFCDPGGTILDPFAGGSVRGIVAHYLGYKYTGIELRAEQVESNRQQGVQILDPDNQPEWIIGDSSDMLERIDRTFDMVFSCPPYADLERYSDDPRDLSTMDHQSFFDALYDIVAKSIKRLKSGGFAVFVVGEVRRRGSGGYIGLVPETINAFKRAGAEYWNEGILLNTLATAAMRATKQMEASRKLVKVHQNVLIFRKH